MGGDRLLSRSDQAMIIAIIRLDMMPVFGYDANIAAS